VPVGKAMAPIERNANIMTISNKKTTALPATVSHCFSSGRKQLMSAVALTASLALANPAYANYLWLEKDGAGEAAGNRFRVYSGELAKRDAAMPQIEMPKAFPADASSSLPLTTAGDHLQIDRAPAAGDLRFSAREITGKNTVVFYQARYGRSETKAVNDLELVPTEAGGNTFRLMWKGNAVAASQVNVETSEGWRRVLAPAKDGTVTLGTPFPGLYVLEVTAKVNGSVTIDGKEYTDVRHVATLSFEVAR